VIEFRNPEYPWPDRPEIPELVLDYPFEFEGSEEGGAAWSEDPFQDRFERPSEGDINEENIVMLRRQCLFRWAAQSIAVAMSKLSEVQKVAAFGAVAQPLEMEVPQFRQFRRHRVEVMHVSALKELKRAMGRGLSFVQDTPYGGVAHHQVDVHVVDAGRGDYRGRLSFLASAPSRGSASVLSQAAGRNRSSGSSKNIHLIPRNLGALRKSFCSTGPADFWSASHRSAEGAPDLCSAPRTRIWMTGTCHSDCELQA
jgi:hypothetical protein